MYEDNNWNAVTGDELAGFLDQISPIDGKYGTSPQSTQVHWRTLPFYDTAALIRVRDSNWDAAESYYLTDQGSLFRLNGTTPPIHEVNRTSALRLDEETVPEYLRFFCFFTHGDRGPFHIVETMNNPHLPEEMSEADRAYLEKEIQPVSLAGRGENGEYLYNAVICYAHEPFMAEFAVNPDNGMVEMLDSLPLIQKPEDRLQTAFPAADQL